MSVFVTNILSQPFGIAFGPDGNLYVANGNSNEIVRFSGTTGEFVDEFVTTGLSFPVQFIFGPDTNFYTCSFGSTTVQRHSSTNGSSLGTFIASGNGLNGPNFLTFRPQGSGPTDRDADGMPDYWEITYSAAGLSPSVSNSAVSDYDGDYVTDVDEFSADTVPDDSNDFFRVQWVSRQAGELVSLRASTNRIYNLQVRNPGVDWSNVAGAVGFAGSGITHTVSGLNTTSDYRYYRAEVLILLL